jgi:hypothetical protein
LPENGTSRLVDGGTALAEKNPQVLLGDERRG